MERCPECKKTKIITDKKTGDDICSSCGRVLRERSIASSQRKEIYTESGHSFHEPRLFFGFDETEPSISMKMKTSITRLKRWVSFKPDPEKKVALNKVLLAEFLREISLDFRLTDVFKLNLQRNLKKATERKIQKSSQKAFLSALFCLSYREIGYPNPIKKVSEITGVSKKLIFKHYQLLMIGMNKKPKGKLTQTSLDSFLGKVSERIVVPFEIQNDFLKIFPTIYKKEVFMGKNRKGLMAGLLYSLLKEKRGYTTLGRVAKATGISEGTITKRVKDIHLLKLGKI